jgi:hypothetical protein
MLDQIQEGRCGMRTNIVLLLIALFMMSNCSHKVVPLKKIESTSYFILQLEKADLYFSKEKVLEASFELIQKESLKSRRDQMTEVYNRLKDTDFKTLYVTSKIDKDVPKEDVENYLFLSLVYYDLLKEGNVKVYNKLSNKFENKITYEIRESGLGDKGTVFRFSDGTEFYYHLIAL